MIVLPVLTPLLFGILAILAWQSPRLQRALGLAQGKLNKAWEKAGIDLSALPPGFSF